VSGFKRITTSDRHHFFIANLNVLSAECAGAKGEDAERGEKGEGFHYFVVYVGEAVAT